MTVESISRSVYRLFFATHHTENPLPAMTARTAAASIRSTKENPPKSRQEERRSTSHQRLVEAAITLISKQGSSGTSLAQVGSAGGYSRGLPGERFGNKLGLLQAVVDHMFEWLNERISKQIQGKTGIDALRTRINCHIDAAVENPELHKALYHLIIDSMGVEPDLRPRIAQLETAYRDRFITHLLEAKQTGDIASHVDVSQLAMIIIGSMRGVIIQALVADNVDALRGLKEHLSHILIVACRFDARVG